MSTGLDRQRDRSLPREDPDALGDLMKALEPRLTAVAMRFTHDAVAAEDVVQNAFVKMLRHGHRFRGDSRVSTWMHRIVANEALMWLRARRRRPSTLPLQTGGVEIRDPGPDACAQLARSQRETQVRRALSALDSDERDVIQHCALDGRSYADYAEARGLHAGAVKSRAFRARRRLAAVLARHLADSA